MTQRERALTIHRLPVDDSESDREHIARIAEGDRSAMAPLYARHAAALLRVGGAILRSDIEAEDVVHDLFVVLADRACQYRPALGSVRAWLASAVRNACIDRLRRNRRGQRVFGKLVVHAQEPEDEGARIRAVDGARTLRCVAALPDPYRATLVELYSEDLTFSELAARRNVPLGTVKSRVARAFDVLRAANGRAAA